MTYIPMTQADYDRLAGILGGFPSEDAMNLEELDGYLSAIVCSPVEVLPEEYFPQLWGGEGDEEDVFPDVGALTGFETLISRHMFAVIERLESGEEFVPLLLQDEHGAITGNDWARGFVRGLDLCSVDWADLLDDEEKCGLLVPIFALAYEHELDPETRPFEEPVDDEQRELLIAGLGVTVPMIYAFWAPERQAYWDDEEGDDDFLPQMPFRRETPKVGRNEPCPCGSGKKYKHCCGAGRT